MGIRLRACFFVVVAVVVFFSFFVTNKVVQDWIKIIDLESRIETEMIVIFCCGVRMTLVLVLMGADLNLDITSANQNNSQIVNL